MTLLQPRLMAPGPSMAFTVLEGHPEPLPGRSTLRTRALSCARCPRGIGLVECGVPPQVEESSFMSPYRSSLRAADEAGFLDRNLVGPVVAAPGRRRGDRPRPASASIRGRRCPHPQPCVRW